MIARRGFTLVEILVVVSVLAAIAVIATPPLVNRIADRGLAESGERLTRELERVRADAVRDNAAIAVWAFDHDAQRRGFIALIATDADWTPDDAGPSPTAARPRTASASAREPTPPGADRLFDLPNPIRLVKAREQTTLAAALNGTLDARSAAGPGVSAGALAPPVDASGAEPEPWRLAIFLPTGEAITTEPAMLRTDDRGVRLEPHPLVGVTRRAVQLAAEEPGPVAPRAEP